MQEPISFCGIIERWPSVHHLARDIGANIEMVRQWYQRDSIASGWFYSIVKAAQHKGYVDVNYQSICIAAHNRRVSASPAKITDQSDRG